jgi:hypothetical protein
MKVSASVDTVQLLFNNIFLELGLRKVAFSPIWTLKLLEGGTGGQEDRRQRQLHERKDYSKATRAPQYSCKSYKALPLIEVGRNHDILDLKI